MNSKIVEYKQRYFEVDNEVEDELIITQNRHNVVVDFLNNYPELWKIIYKFKSIMEKKEKENHFINCMEWEIGFINTLNIQKMISIWNDLAYTEDDWIFGKDWKKFTKSYDGNNQIQDFRFQLFLRILGKRIGYRFRVGTHETYYQPLLELKEEGQYKNGKLYRDIFAKTRKRNIEYIGNLFNSIFSWRFIKDDIINILEKHYKQDGIITYPHYEDCTFGNGDNGKLGLRGGANNRYYRNIDPLKKMPRSELKYLNKQIYSKLIDNN